MDAKGLPQYENLAYGVREAKQGMGEIAAQFPESGEAYLALELEERMEVATKVLRAYAPNFTGTEYDPKRGTPAPADVEAADLPGIVFKGEVSFKRLMRGSERRKRRELGGIGVDVAAEDKATGVSSTRHYNLGGIKRGEHRDEAGEKQTGWFVWSGSDSEERPLSSQFGESIVEFVDTAVVGLLDGEMLTQHRQFLGAHAVEGAAAETEA